MSTNFTPRLDCYSLWLMAADDSQTQLQTLINTLSDSTGSSQFTGHITLITPRTKSDIQTQELIRCGMTLANAHTSPSVEFTAIGFRNTHFQSMFLQAVLTEQLRTLNLTARGYINQPDDAPYMPHLSLVYGEYEWAIKKSLIPQITSQIQLPYIVKFDRLVLARLHGVPSEWTIEQQYRFND